VRIATGADEVGKLLIDDLSQNIHPTGSVVVWYRSFETTRNKDMGVLNPEYAEFLSNVNDRIFDLMEVFNKGYYVHPDFKGSSSLKNVLPVMLPELTYEGMGVSCGEEAMLAWWGLIRGDLTGEEKERTLSDLREYCKLDTWAMVEIWRLLLEEVGEG
jgi:hypothetical protein